MQLLKYVRGLHTAGIVINLVDVLEEEALLEVRLRKR